MSNAEKLNSFELMHQIIDLLDSNLTTNCVHCKAVFPKEYGFCPQCSTDQASKATKFNMTVTWK